jgi:hypothetical protein
VDPSKVRWRQAVLAVLALSAIAFAAATLDSTTDPNDRVGFGSLNQDSDQGSEGTPTETTTPPGDQTEEQRPSVLDLEAGGSPRICVSWLRTLPAVVGILLAFVALYLVARWRTDSMYALGVVLVFVYPAFFGYIILTSCSTATERDFGFVDVGQIENPTQQGGGVIGGPGSVTTPALPTYLLFFLLVIAVGVVGVLVLTSDHDQIEEEATVDDEDEEDASPNVRAVGRAAGRAADRIETSSEFENEVYRAWAEMTTHLNVDRPESSTPGEFAAAAVDAGMDRDDVEELTDLFTEVRYGGAAVTDDRERQAVAVLRRIEATYAGDES